MTEEKMALLELARRAARERCAAATLEDLWLPRPKRPLMAQVFADPEMVIITRHTARQKALCQGPCCSRLVHVRSHDHEHPPGGDKTRCSAAGPVV